ncbi:hypothetical protein CQ12_00435 [Bradyrhizobium jicamae]|uniref:DUF6894 domain-containing protein n=2 Tax=Bradyrhizobium jicamae TaxID=280332 RepID=A0A0R3LPR2_9BRAD|nr:hypothetical protein CQ12_00435 [Bradyrhizobium jicamae]
MTVMVVGQIVQQPICDFGISLLASLSQPRELTMPRYYFHQHTNGRRFEDREGTILRGAADACTSAIRRAPARLRMAIRESENDNFIATEISDGARTLFVVRGKIIIEKG